MNYCTAGVPSIWLDIESCYYGRHFTVISNFITYKTKNVLTQLAVNTLLSL